MKKSFLFFVSALICGAMVLESSGNGRSPKPLCQGDAQPPGEHQVEGSSVPKPLVSRSFDLPVGYVVYGYERNHMSICTLCASGRSAVERVAETVLKLHYNNYSSINF